MSSDWMREHNERNANKGGASMVGVGVALRAKERGRCRFVNVTGRFPMSSDWVREHKETNATKEGAPMGGVCVAFRAKEGGLFS